MKLKIILPTEIMVDVEVTKVTAEASNGLFCLLPRHIDFVAALVPGLLSFVKAGNEVEEFLAVDEGILVKCGPEVLVSTRKAVRGPELGQLREPPWRRLQGLNRPGKAGSLSPGQPGGQLYPAFPQVGGACLNKTPRRNAPCPGGGFLPSGEAERIPEAEGPEPQWARGLVRLGDVWPHRLVGSPSSPGRGGPGGLD